MVDRRPKSVPQCAAKRAGLAVRPLLEVAGYQPKQRFSAMSLGENRGDVRASARVRCAAVADLIHTLAVDEDSGSPRTNLHGFANTRRERGELWAMVDALLGQAGISGRVR